jgi:DNA-binding Xre family transcriptional regulator
MGAANKIRILLIERNMKIKDLAEQLGYSGNNLSNKLKEDNFSEKELLKIARILNCDYNITFTMKDTGKEI